MYVFSQSERSFLDSIKLARLATAGPEVPLAKPHCVPVCFANVAGTIWIALDQKPKSGRPLRRLLNIEGNPQVALTVDHYEDDWSKLAFLMVEGKAALAPLPAVALEALVARYPQYASMTLLEGIAITPQRAVYWTAAAGDQLPP